VFLLPSGSDAEYIPLLITKILNKGKNIVNIVSCNEEVGSGTLDAAGGKLFSAVQPIAGYIEGPAKAGDGVKGLNDGVRTVAINARMPNGEVTDKAEQMNTILAECLANGEIPMVHKVHGSKTGIVEALSEEVKTQVAAQNGMIVMDACQGRNLDKDLSEAVDAGIIVLFTGSKFFRSPPFCGAVIVPAEIMQKLMADETTVIPHGLKTFIGQSELPDDLTVWRNQLDPSINYGLALRWEAGLAEIEPTLKIEESVRVAQAQHWSNAVKTELSKYSNLNYFSAAEDTTSIISVRIKSTIEGKEWFNKG